MKAIDETVEANISSPFDIKEKKRFFAIKSPSKIFMESLKNIDAFKEGEHVF